VSPALADAPPQGPPSGRRANGHIVPPPRTGGGDDDERDPSRRPLFDNVRLAMLFLVVGEVIFFAALVSGFFVLRLSAPAWPPPAQPRLPVAVTGVNTLVLLGSSVAMLAASRAGRRGDRARLLRGLGLTAALGALFLAVQGYEWTRLIGFGLTMSSGAYGATFYTLIGTHAAHVVGALTWLAVTLTGAARGRFAGTLTPGLRACAIYWHFVVALWPVLYVSVYLL
jgi:cytochrome c oxidase subunit III